MSGRKRLDGCRFWPVNEAVVEYHCPGAASSASSFCERAVPPRIFASVEGVYAASSVSLAPDCALGAPPDINAMTAHAATTREIEPCHGLPSVKLSPPRKSPRSMPY